MGNKALTPLELYTSGSNPTVPTPPEGAIYYNSTANEIRMYSGSTWYASVNTETAQSVGGAKTFTSDLVVSTANGTATLAGAYLSIVGTGSYSGVGFSASVLSGNHRIKANPPDATSGDTLRDSYIELYSNYWNGAASIAEYITLKSARTAASNNGYEFRVAMEGTDRLVLSSDGILSTSSYYSAPAATTSIPSMRLPHGTAPSAPTNGDIWTTTAGIYVRINGATVGPLSSGGSVTYATTTELANASASAESAGTSDTVARGDHKHDISTGTPVSLSGSASSGSSTSIARSDHQHGTSGLVVAAPLVFSVNGTLGVASGVARLGVEGNFTILGIRARVDTAPTGASIKVDVNKNGSTIFTTGPGTNRPDIAVSTNASSYVTNMDTTSLASGDYLTVDVDQVGSTIPGSHLTVVVWVVSA